MDYKEILEPFASRGDRERIDYAQNGLDLSWLGGYTYLYGLKPEEANQSPYIEREKFNEIFYLTTAKMLDIEQQTQDNKKGLGDTENKLNQTINSLSNDYVTLRTNQTISGVKTFSALPRSTKNPTHNDELVRKGYLDSGQVQGLLQGQWTGNFTSKSFTGGVWYKNPYNKTIMVCVTANYGSRASGLGEVSVLRGGVTVTISRLSGNNNSDDTSHFMITFLLNAGDSWKVQHSSQWTGGYTYFA